MSLQLPRFMQEVVYIEQINRCLTCLDPSDFHHAYLRCVDKETVTAQLHSSRRLDRYAVKYWEVHTQPEGLISSPDSAESYLGDYFTGNSQASSQSLESLESRRLGGLEVTIGIILQIMWHHQQTLDKFLTVWMSSENTWMLWLFEDTR